MAPYDDAVKAAAEALSEHYEGDGWGYFGGAAEAAVAAAAPILLAAERAEVERLNRVIAAYEEDADVALVEMAEAVEAESQAADRAIARKDAEIERLREEVEVWKHTAERAQALSARCMRDERAARTALAAEAAKFQAETLTTSFLMCRIRRHIEEFDRSALTCDRCGWRGARVVHVDGDLRELRCGHERCLLARLAARIAETAPEDDPTCPTCGHPMTVHDVNEGWICNRHPRIAETAPEEGS